MSETNNSIDNLGAKEKNPDTKQVIIRYGVILGFISVILAVVMNILGAGDPMNPKPGASMAIGCGSLILSIVLMVLAVKAIRDSQHNGGKIKLGDAFMLSFLVGMIATVIGSLYNFIDVSFLNPEKMEMTREMMEQAFEDAGEVDEAAQGITSFFMNFATNPTAQLISTIIGGAFFNAIIAIIVAAIMKKD